MTKAHTRLTAILLHERQKTNDLSSLLYMHAKEWGHDTYSIEAIILDNSNVNDFEADGCGAKYHTLDAILNMVRAIEGVEVAL